MSLREVPRWWRSWKVRSEAMGLQVVFEGDRAGFPPPWGNPEVNVATYNMSLAHGKKTIGFGRRSNGFGKKSNGFGRKSNGRGNESNGCGKESNGFGRKSNGFGRKSNGFGRKSNGFGKESSGFGKLLLASVVFVEVGFDLPQRHRGTQRSQRNAEWFCLFCEVRV